MNDSEVWKDVAGYEGLYKVSNTGNVYSVERKNTMGRKCGGRILTPRPHRGGYLQVALCKNGVSKNKTVHRLVSEAFIPNPNNYPEINHLDEDKSNNNEENLEWCTREYNMNFGTMKKRVSKKLSKKVRAVNVETGEVLTFNSTREAERKGYAHGDVSSACRGIYGSSGHLYKGYQWSYD